jgi:hypothetical protein
MGEVCNHKPICHEPDKHIVTTLAARGKSHKEQRALQAKRKLLGYSSNSPPIFTIYSYWSFSLAKWVRILPLDFLRCILISSLLKVIFFLQIFRQTIYTSHLPLARYVSCLFVLPYLIILIILLEQILTFKLTPWSESASELYRPSDRRLSAKWFPTFCG